MPYRDNNPLLGYLAFAGLCVAAVVILAYGWIGALALVATYLGGFFLYSWLLSARTRLAEWARLRRRCVHGVPRAMGEPERCSNCVAERERETRDEAKHRAEEERIRKAAAARRRDEYIARIRVPEYLRRMDPREFEELACRLFEAMGYAVERTPFSGDGGVDAYLRRDESLAILQAKRVHGYVGEPVLRDLFGTMTAQRAAEAFVATTGRVSPQAREWMRGKAITVYELDDLLSLFERHLPGSDFVPPDFSPPERAVLICPRCGSDLRVVRWKRKRFYGCSGFPGCRYTRSM